MNNLALMTNCPVVGLQGMSNYFLFCFDCGLTSRYVKLDPGMGAR